MIPCSDDDGVDDDLMFPALQPDSDSITFPFIQNLDKNLTKKKNLATCLKDVIDIQSKNKLPVEVLFDSNKPICCPNVEKDVVVVSKASKLGTKRVYDKKHNCVYCNIMYSKIARHLEQKHSKETEVAFALSLPKNSNERKNKWNELLKKGDFNHNIGVLKTNSGFIIPCKRPSKDVDACKFLPCPHCFGLYRRKELWKHLTICNNNKEGKTNSQTEARMLLPLPPNVSKDFYDKIICAMVTDDVSNVVKMTVSCFLLGRGFFKKVKVFHINTIM